ncbi:MAG: BON domain-containing protein [Burkholderiales bacterium]
MNTNFKRTAGLGFFLIAGAALLAGCDQKPAATKEAQKSSSFSSSVEATAKKVEKAADTAMDKTQSAMSTAGDKIETAADKTKVAMSDGAITAAVKSKFIADPDLKAIDINVDTTNGAVLLKGNVDTERNRDKATTVAREVDGVKSVSNALVVGKK